MELDPTEVSLLIGAGATLITAITGLLVAIFRQNRQIHTLVNNNYTQLTAVVDALRTEVSDLKATALAKAEAREAPPPQIAQ